MDVRDQPHRAIWHPLIGRPLPPLSENLRYAYAWCGVCGVKYFGRLTVSVWRNTDIQKVRRYLCCGSPECVRTIQEGE